MDGDTYVSNAFEVVDFGEWWLEGDVARFMPRNDVYAPRTPHSRLCEGKTYSSRAFYAYAAPWATIEAQLGRDVYKAIIDGVLCRRPASRK